jgi:hypothetical protein
MLNPQTSTSTGVSFTQDLLAEENESNLPWPNFQQMAALNLDGRKLPEQATAQENLPPTSSLYETVYQDLLQLIPYYRTHSVDKEKLFKEAHLYSVIAVTVEHCLLKMGLSTPEAKHLMAFFLEQLCAFDRPGLLITYAENNNFETLADLIANVLIDIRISKQFPKDLFISYCSKVLQHNDLSLLDNPNLDGTVRIKSVVDLPILGENLNNQIPNMVATVETLRGNDISGPTMVMLGEARKANLIDRKGWLAPLPPADMIERLPLVKRHKVKDLDLDNSDLAAETTHYVFDFNALPAPNDSRIVESKYPGTARFIRIKNSIILPEKVEVNGTNPIIDALLSMKYSPFDRTGTGPHIDSDIRTLLQKQPELAITILQQAGFDVNKDTLMKFLEDNVISLNASEHYESTSEIVAKSVERQLVGTENNDVLAKFINALRTQEEFYLLERLTPPTLQYKGAGDKNGEDIAESITGLPTLMFMMMEMAIDSFNQGIDLWLIQCDNSFTRQIKTFFGEESFYSFINKEGQGIMQIKKNTRETGKIKEDRCNTMILDIEKAMIWLLTAHKPEELYYQLGQYVLDKLDATVKQKVQNKLEELTLPSIIKIPVPQEL